MSWSDHASNINMLWWFCLLHMYEILICCPNHSATTMLEMLATINNNTVTTMSAGNNFPYKSQTSCCYLISVCREDLKVSLIDQHLKEQQHEGIGNAVLFFLFAAYQAFPKPFWSLFIIASFIVIICSLDFWIFWNLFETIDGWVQLQLLS